MVDGVSSEIGQSALLGVEEEPRPGPELALTQPLLALEQIVLGKALRLKNAILGTAQVK